VFLGGRKPRPLAGFPHPLEVNHRMIIAFPLPAMMHPRHRQKTHYKALDKKWSLL
jgi:hypothetical protein